MPSPHRSSQTGVALATQSLSRVHFFSILEEVSAGISASSDSRKTILLICVWVRITSAKTRLPQRWLVSRMVLLSSACLGRLHAN